MDARTSRETIGQLVLSIWLEELRERSMMVRRATDGWLADALHVLHEGDEPVALVARFDWVSIEDATEFVEITSGALDEHADYEHIDCSACPELSWEGPTGVLTIRSLAAPPSSS